MILNGFIVIRFKILLAVVLCFGFVGSASLFFLQARMNTEFEALEQTELKAGLARVVTVTDACLLYTSPSPRD